MASVEPSSTRRVRRVKTERIRKTIIKALIIRKMARPRRMIMVVNAALPRAFVPALGTLVEEVEGAVSSRGESF